MLLNWRRRCNTPKNIVRLFIRTVVVKLYSYIHSDVENVQKIKYFRDYCRPFRKTSLFWLKCWPFIVFVDFLNTCDDSPIRQLICSDHLHAYNSLLQMGIIWCKNINSPFLFWLIYLYNKQTPIYFRDIHVLALELLLL